MNGEELGDYEIKMRTKKGEVLDVIVRAHKIIMLYMVLSFLLFP